MKIWITRYADSGKLKVKVKYPISDDSTMKKKSIKLVQDSIKYKDDRYEVGISWKRNPKCLPNNYDMAAKRMINMETKLLWDDKTANEYNQIIEGYISKGYVKILKKDPETENKKWFLPNFAVIKPDKEMNKGKNYI